MAYEQEGRVKVTKGPSLGCGVTQQWCGVGGDAGLIGEIIVVIECTPAGCSGRGRGEWVGGGGWFIRKRARTGQALLGQMRRGNKTTGVETEILSRRPQRKARRVFLAGEREQPQTLVVSSTAPRPISCEPGPNPLDISGRRSDTAGGPGQKEDSPEHADDASVSSCHAMHCSVQPYEHCPNDHLSIGQSIRPSAM